MRLVFLRHANSIFNKEGLFQGQHDCNLSEEGIADLKLLKQTFNKKYDYCYASPLKRTKLTALAIADKEIIRYDDRLKEIKLGIWQNTPITEDKIEAYRNGFIPEGAESKPDLDQRVKEFLEDLKNKHKDSDTILIVTHGGTINSVQRVFSVEPLREVDNLGILEIEVDAYNNIISIHID